MKTNAISLPVALLCVFTTTAVLAAEEELIMYPNRGQSMEQLEKDKYECYVWAKDQSGYDPLSVEGRSGQAQNPAPESPRHSVGAGAARGGLAGALLGAGLGALLGGRRGALIGGTVGGVGGALTGAERERAANEYEAQRQAGKKQDAKTALRDKYEGAFEACLIGRGYTIR